MLLREAKQILKKNGYKINEAANRDHNYELENDFADLMVKLMCKYYGLTREHLEILKENGFDLSEMFKNRFFDELLDGYMKDLAESNIEKIENGEPEKELNLWNDYKIKLHL